MLASINGSAERLKPAPRRMLVVNDEEPIRIFVERVLRDAGYEAVTAEGGFEAIDIVGKVAPFDLLVTDLMMPQMPGRRARPPFAPDRSRPEDPLPDRLQRSVVQGKDDALGGEAFLDKPCSVKGLREAVALLFFDRLDMPPID